MPYYCTVPRCTSMAGKAKNVSFHQFPRDEELAKLWNRILKRGKPYTKYSKVCSLHFKAEDYTVTSVGKNKGQWRTLRKDAVPSQNLPSDSPAPYTRRHSSAWVPVSPGLVDPMVQQQMAQAIYMQTMLAMHGAGASELQSSNAQPNIGKWVKKESNKLTISHTDQPSQSEATAPSPSGSSLSEIELLLRCKADTEQKEETFQCQECSKCFKDPDVFIIHKRIHKKEKLPIEKENYSVNIQDKQEMLRANPILANLLKSNMRLEPESHILEASVLTVENQIMSALASNMEAYIRTLSSMLSSQTSPVDNVDGSSGLSEDASKCVNDDECANHENESKSDDEGGCRVDDCEEENKSVDGYKDYHCEDREYECKESGYGDDKYKEGNGEDKDYTLSNEDSSGQCVGENDKARGEEYCEDKVYKCEDVNMSTVEDTYQQRGDICGGGSNKFIDGGYNCENEDQEKPDCDSSVETLALNDK